MIFVRSPARAHAALAVAAACAAFAALAPAQAAAQVDPASGAGTDSAKPGPLKSELKSNAKSDATAAAKPVADPVQKVEVKAAAANYDPRRDDTASKTVLNADEIRKYGDDNIYDVLKRAPGVTVSGKSIQMRGLGGGYTQILVNGDRPPPGFSFDALTPDQIERIEIIRAGSAEFSMQGVAGTINIVLRKVTAKPQRDVRVGTYRAPDSRGANLGGTWGDKAGALSYVLNGSLFGGRNDNLSLGAERFTLPDGTVSQSRVSRYNGGGPYRGVFLFPRLAYKDEDGDESNLSAILQASRASWTSNGHVDDLAGAFPAPDYLDTSQATPFRQRMQQLEANRVAKLAGGKLDVTATLQRTRNADESFNGYATAGRAQTLLRDWNTVKAGHRSSLRGKYTRSLFDGHSLGAGFDTSVESNDETRDRVERVNADPATRTFETFDVKVKRLAGWAQDEWNWSKQLSVYAGARWEGVVTDSRASDVPGTHSNSHVLSPVAQALYKFPGGSGRQLRAAYTHTYKAPTIDQLTARRYEAPLNTRFNADYSGNPGLRPETADGVDLTYEHFLADGAMVSATASRRAIRDVIVDELGLDGGGRWLYHPVNDGDARVDSLQLEAKLPGKLLGAAWSGFDGRASYSRNWSRVSSVPGPDNRLAAQTPASANVGVDYRKDKLTAGASLAWTQGGTVRVSDAEYQVQQTRRNLDAYLLWKFDAHVQLRVSGTNLLRTDNLSDRYYRDTSGTSRSQSFQAGYARLGVNLELKL